MTFSELAQFVASNGSPDGDFHPSPPTSGSYFSSPYGLRLALYLKRFTMDALLLYKTLAPVIVASGVLELDLSDSDVSDYSFFDVEAFWIGNQQIQKVRGANDLIDCYGPLTPTGTPTRFAQLDTSRIIFDVTTADDLDDCFARGYYRHPDIEADDDTVVGVTADCLDVFDRYAQAFLRENSSIDDVGLPRLQRIDQQAYNGVQALRLQRMKNMIPAVYR